jgi:threonine/homoserine/homoserine lactone efflux protein
MGHVLSVLPAFLLTCVAVAALPGPSTALFLHRTVRDGRKAGLAAVAGNEIGVFCYAPTPSCSPPCTSPARPS